MKKTILTIIILIAIITSYIILKPEPIFEYKNIKLNNTTFNIVKITPENLSHLKTYYKTEPNNPYITINNLNQNSNFNFATNGGIFSPKYEPLGLFIQNNQTLFPLNTKEGAGNFFMQPNGVFFIKNNHPKITETKKFETSPTISTAIQSGPLLVINNQINSLFNPESKSKYIRNGVGVDKNGNTFFAISTKPVTFHQFASLFKNELNCPNALYLDGAISEMYIKNHQENTNQKFSVIIGIEE